MQGACIMQKTGSWLSILDFAKEKNQSISTIRRSIKAGRVRYKEENGRYLIWVEEIKPSLEKIQELEIEKLKKIVRLQKEEIEDLKMLLSVYEKSSSLKTTRFEDLPVLPEIEL